jgi:hypothetical protein
MEHLFWLIKLIKLLYNIDWQSYFSDIDIMTVLTRWETNVIAAWKWIRRFIFGQNPRLTYRACKKRYNDVYAATKFWGYRRKLWIWGWLKAPVVILTLIVYIFWISLAVFIPIILFIYIYSRFLFAVKYICWWWVKCQTEGRPFVRTLKRLKII